MKYTQEEIINALKVIKETCQENQEPFYCDGCPLSKDNDCVVRLQTPEKWNIRSKATPWKAFE